jgi:ribosome biogenesis protein BMS1
LLQRAVVLEPGERKLYTLVQQLNTIRNAKARACRSAAARAAC